MEFMAWWGSNKSGNNAVSKLSPVSGITVYPTSSILYLTGITFT